MRSLALVVVALAGPALADAPAFIPVQGFLTDAAGTPLAGAHDVRFRIYTTDAGGAAVYDEQITDIAVEEGLFSVELGGVTPLDLGLFEDESTLFLGLTIDDDTAELAPRIVLGTVPWAAFANRAGDARTLDGFTPEDFRQAADPVPFEDLTNVPADADTLGGLSCVAGDIAFFNGASWTCLAFAEQGCAPGDVVTGFDTNGDVTCTTPTDEGVRGQACPANQFMTGINADGTLACSTLDGVVRTYINTNCFIYLGTSDDCEGTCGTPSKLGRVNGNLNACQTNLGANSDDNTCDTQLNVSGATDVRTFGLNFNGDVDGNDKLFIGFHCEP